MVGLRQGTRHQTGDSESGGKRTSGVDGITWSTQKSGLEAASSRKRGGHRPWPLRRLYIPEGDGTKMRPLEISCMVDRAQQSQQALHLLASESVAETGADPNSYGFRFAGPPQTQSSNASQRWGAPSARGGFGRPISVAAWIAHSNAIWAIKCVRRSSARIVGDLHAQAFASSATTQDGVELAALYTPQRLPRFTRCNTV
ncbi:hypothetical protein LMG27174_01445 [Paraburkholderia rhynchosiae]|uniref:Uncharacterized protein n=1 Tax=Paraburkholderia rhynchosiae TaxID=487049 RepID=A0A6J5A746_9BURK|nr:hypothetical protein LMG27174_01445 [Paraburkholderia rhynchosiae]